MHISPIFLAVSLASCISASPLESRSLFCKTESQPNPIKSTYPKEITGTINGTLAVLPIPLSQAQEIVGEDNVILESAYRKLLPSFPAGMYPAIVQAVLDHDDVGFGIPVADFSVSLLSLSSCSSSL